MSQRLLLTGASGFLGWNIIQEAGHWDIIALVNRHTEDLPAQRTLSFDLTRTELVDGLVHRYQPDAIIHCAAISDANYCQQQPEETELLNVQASVQLAGVAASLNIPFVFTSTDLVFNGRQGYYTEGDRTDPLSAYGLQKAAAEQGILEVNPRACVCRMPLMFGNPGPHARSFIQPFLQNLREGKAINLFTDEYRTAVDGASAAQGLLLAVEQGWQGIWHLGGKDRLSRYEFGMLLAEVFDIKKPNINAVRQADMQMAAPRPPDVSLNSSRAFSRGYDPATNAQALKGLRGLV